MTRADPGPGPVAITVAVCTRDRAGLLGACLDATLAQQAPPGGFEVLVVDNGSVDATPTLVAARATIDARVRALHHPSGGLAAARNAASRHAQGRVLVFLDDDARPRPGWLRALVAAFDDAAVAAVGGPVLPVWPGGRPPAWLPDHLAAYYSILAGPAQRGPMGPGTMPIATNLAVRSALLAELGGFREDLGRVGTRLLSNEDLELLQRIARCGGTIWFEPDAVVDHVIPAARARRSWIVRRCYWQGRSEVDAPPDGAPRLGRARDGRPGLLSDMALLVRTALRGGAARHDAVAACCILARHLGQAVGSVVDPACRGSLEELQKPGYRRAAVALLDLLVPARRRRRQA